MTPTRASPATLGISLSEAAEVWSRFVSQAGDATHCHLWGWRELMADVLHHECSYWMALDEHGEVAGVLPLVDVRAWPMGRFVISMPFLNDGGAIGTNAARAQLTAHAAREADRRGADLLELRGRHPVASSLQVSHRKLTVVLELPPTADELWTLALPSKVRSQIRRPKKEGMYARFGPEQLGAFYQVFARHMRDLGTPVLPMDFFERILTVFGESVELGVIYSGEAPVAAGCGFLWRDEFELVWAASLREWSRSAPNMLLYWSFMERVIARGARMFNFGRCTPGGGTHRFKGQWGGEDVPLPWLQWSATGVGATPGADRPLLRAAAATWSRLPLPLTNRIGPLLARRLP